jgi:hypothetical protein
VQTLRYARTTILATAAAAATLQLLPFAGLIGRDAYAAEVERVASDISITGTGVIIDDDEDQFRQRQRVPSDGFGGIENLYMEWLYGEDVTIKLEGRGIVDANDYLAKIRIEKPDKGYVSAGYREFRTWYDGTGGFFPQTSTIFSVFDENLHLDRGQAWFEAGVRAPNAPKLTFRYAHLSRDGKKSSNSWGETNLTGGAGIRSIVPAFWHVDEDRDALDIGIEHVVLGTTVGGAFRYETSSLDDSLNERRFPTEAADRSLTQHNKTDGDMYNLNAYTTTPLIDNKLVVSTAYSYSDLKNDIRGSRIYGATYDAPFDPTFPGSQPLDTGFIDLDGATKVEQHVGMFTIQGRPIETLQMTAGLRVEQEDITGASDWTNTDVGFGGSPPPTTLTPLAAKSDADTTGFIESFEVRYTGLTNFVWFARGEWEQSDGNLNERQIQQATAVTDLERGTNIDLSGQKYVAGTTWYPLRRVNVAARYTYRLRDYDYDHGPDSTDNTTGSNRYPAFMTKLKTETNAGDIRITWRILDSLRATGRYDIAFTDYKQRVPVFGDNEAAKVRTQAVGGNLSWSPTTTSYLQGDFNYVNSYTETPEEEDLTGNAATVLSHRFDNDYWTASVVGGIALSERTDLRGQYFFYKADNYDNTWAARQPFGSDATEHGFSIGLAHQLTEAIRWRLAYAYFKNDEDLAGGREDYTASLISTSFDFKF